MLRETGIRYLRLTAVTMLMMLAARAALAAGANAPVDEVAAGRAAWLLQRGSLQDLPLTGRLADLKAKQRKAKRLCGIAAGTGEKGAGEV